MTFTDGKVGIGTTPITELDVLEISKNVVLCLIGISVQPVR